MKKIVLITVFIMLSVITVWGRGVQEEEAAEVRAVTTIFPLYDFSRIIGGERADVSLLLPPGVEAHSYEPTPRDIMTINQADMFIYAGEAMEPWAERVIRSLTNPNIIIIDASKHLDLIEGHHHHHHDDHHHDSHHHDHHHDDHHHDSHHHDHHHDDHHHDSHHHDHQHDSHHHDHDHDDHHHDSHHHDYDHDDHHHDSHHNDHDHDDHHHDSHHHDHDHDGHHHHGDVDPHFWTDPLMAVQVVEHITKGFIEADSDGSDYYKANAEKYTQQLRQLHETIASTVETLRVRSIIYGGHFAFGYFAQRYGFEHVSPYAGFSPNAEPTAQRIVELIDIMRDLDLKVIYHEELIEPRVARIIAEETGAKLMLLHGIHNVSREEQARGVTYISLMEENLQRLVEGIGQK